MIRAVGVAALLALGACASAPEAAAPGGAPDVRLTEALPAPAQARLYAECIAQAAETGAYHRERDGGTLRFTCTGGTAKWFYEALGTWSAGQGSEYTADGLTWRFSKKLIKDSYGVDGCSRDAMGNHRCVVILNVGAFIEERGYEVPAR
ncbi:MAG: hypothetical protein EON93_13520 [Burkholderiales bacterium]|nr:MAG: hypothetical protein EON93_13520 [Burkholderiales bacterium]